MTQSIQHKAIFTSIHHRSASANLGPDINSWSGTIPHQQGLLESHGILGPELDTS
jgi:hypothetical protein